MRTWGTQILVWGDVPPVLLLFTQQRLGPGPRPRGSNCKGRGISQGLQRSAAQCGRLGKPLAGERAEPCESEGFCCCFSARAGVADRTQHIHLRQCGGMAISVGASLQPGNLLCAFHVARTIWHPANLRIKMAIARLTLFRLGKRLLWPCRRTSLWALV